MKKIVWIIVGCAVAIGAGILISRQRAQETKKRAATTVLERSGKIISEGNSDNGSYTKDKSVQSVEDPYPALSDAVKALVGLDGKKHNYPSLQAAINELGENLSTADMAALREMLSFPNDRFPEKMRPIEINAVKNDVLDLLLRQKQMPEGIGLQIVEMANNPENDPVWRDYCVQFMQPFYERASGERDLATKNTKEHEENNSVTSSAAGGENELTVIHDAMFSALDERDSTIAGTALIGLENLSRTHEEFDRETIVAKASEIALDETASAASRLTALRLASQVSEEKGVESGESAADAARSIAQTGETVLLRSAAIVTLGEVGSHDDRELLESYLLDGNKQIADAAKMALAKMDAGQSPPTEQVDPIVEETTLEPQSTGKLPPILVN